MLIKFLSFAASVLGTARYKAIFLSSVALTVALMTVTVTAFIHNDPAASQVASTVARQVSNSIEQLPSLPLVHRAHTKQDSNTGQTAQNSVTATPNTTTSNPPTVLNTASPTSTTANTSNTSEVPASPAPTIVVDPTTINLSENNMPQTITFTMSDNSSVNWSITAPADPNVQVLPSSTTTAASFSVQVSADQNAISNTTDQLTVTATDTTRNLNTSQTINIVLK